MLDLDTLKRIDAQGMFEVYDKWPEIAENAYNNDYDFVGFHKIDHIVFAGMGGSGAIGDMFSSILSKSQIHVSVVKGYHLPSTVDGNSLIVSTSISGNTVETLTVLDAAKKSGSRVIAISSNGKMENYCIDNEIEFRKLPQFHSPRASFTCFLYSMLRILEPIIPIKNVDVLESLEKLKNLRNEIFSSNLNESNPALSLAYWISGIPLIYYPWGLQAAAIRFKNSLQENAKSHAITEDVVEACHNGIVSWEIPSIVQPILIEGEDDYIKTKERWKILTEYFKENNIDYKEILSVKGNVLSKLICLIYLLDYSSIYRAVLSNYNPSPIKSIDFIKKRL